MIVKLLTEHHMEFLSLKGGCRGSSESTHVEMPHCWKSRALAHFIMQSMSVPYLESGLWNWTAEMQRNSYTMGCPPVRGDNPRALASGLSYVQVDKHGIIILYYLQ